MRQSANYKWNLPEDEDEIDVEDLNTVFTAVDEKLKTHDEELEPVELSSTLKVVSAEGAFSVSVDESGIITSSLISKVNTTWGPAECKQIAYPETVPYSDTIYVYIKVYFSNGKLYYDEYQVTGGPGETAAQQNGAIEIGQAHISPSGKFDDVYLVDFEFDDESADAGSESDMVTMSVRDAILYLMGRIQSMQGGET